mmetsp:Transcript_17234/g.33580  ORF Transcript_17234/g.33580 Transcript_17234/m.33580 type:complete len:266 (+) Transcript_17234:83-880(+)
MEEGDKIVSVNGFPLSDDVDEKGQVVPVPVSVMRDGVLVETIVSIPLDHLLRVATITKDDPSSWSSSPIRKQGEPKMPGQTSHTPSSSRKHRWSEKAGQPKTREWVFSSTAAQQQEQRDQIARERSRSAALAAKEANVLRAGAETRSNDNPHSGNQGWVNLDTTLSLKHEQLAQLARERAAAAAAAARAARTDRQASKAKEEDGGGWVSLDTSLSSQQEQRKALFRERAASAAAAAREARLQRQKQELELLRPESPTFNTANSKT